MKRTYTVLLEEVVARRQTATIAFVLLGFEDARSPHEAAQMARERYDLQQELIAVPSKYWTVT